MSSTMTINNHCGVQLTHLLPVIEATWILSVIEYLLSTSELRLLSSFPSSVFFRISVVFLVV